jgi:hypothetical protein
MSAAKDSGAGSNRWATSNALRALREPNHDVHVRSTAEPGAAPVLIRNSEGEPPALPDAIPADAGIKPALLLTCVPVVLAGFVVAHPDQLPVDDCPLWTVSTRSGTVQSAGPPTSPIVEDWLTAAR